MPEKRGISRKILGKKTDLPFDRREEVLLHNPIFGDDYAEELKQIDKHEIVIKICDKLGSCPSNLHKAEEIFDDLKFDIAEFILHHEYGEENGVRSKLLLWLDSKKNPGYKDRLFSFASKYLK